MLDHCLSSLEALYGNTEHAPYLRIQGQKLDILISKFVDLSTGESLAKSILTSKISLEKAKAFVKTIEERRGEEPCS